MATRRRRNTATTPEPVLEATTPADSKTFDDWVKSWEDNAVDIAHKVGEGAPELTHEEMLEIAEEREAANEIAEEEKAIEVLMSMALADTFEALQAAEEEKGIDNFFDPGSYVQPVRLPAEVVPARPKPKAKHTTQRIINRQRKS